METKIIKVTDKGQISIPIEIRNAIGISVGDDLIAIREGETLCLKKIKVWGRCWRVSDKAKVQDLHIWGEMDKKGLERIAEVIKENMG